MKSIDRHIREMKGYIEDLKMYYKHEILSRIVPYAGVEVRREIGKLVEDLADDIYSHVAERIREIEEEYGLFCFED